jgi:uncharacterized protein
MQIHLTRVRTEPFTWQETLEVSPEMLGSEELLALGPIEWSGRVSFVDPGFYLAARLRYEQTLACDRCLARFTETVDEPVEALLLVDEPQVRDGERELDEEDLGVIHLQGERFDTRPLVLENLQLNLPMKPVCRPDCAGLCPQCGADRNTAPCDCRTERVDPRWAALEKLELGK